MALTRPKYSQIYDTDYKQSCRVATTTNLTNITSGAPSSVDGIALAVGNRILVRSQTTSSQNGIYVVKVLGTGANGQWVRALDADDYTKVTSGMQTIIEEGDTLATKLYRLTTSGNIIPGTTNLAFADVSGGGGGVSQTTSNVAPSSPSPGAEWYRPATDILYKYVYDGTSYFWIDLTSPLYNANTSAIANTLVLRDSGANVSATNFIGVASSAKYADLAEKYEADTFYSPGTVVVFGGTAEVTTTTISHDTRVAGVVSTNPAYLMNSEADGVPVAFTGRVPCQVKGPVNKGDLVVSSSIPGVAQRIDNTLYKPGCVVGKSLSSVDSNEIAVIEVVVGRF